MENCTDKISQTTQLCLSVNLEVPSTVIHVNQEYITEAIQMIFNNHPQALDANSPEEVLQKLGFDC